MYITIEGIDTAGKSTQIELLKKEFKDFLFIKEPGFTDFGKKIREIIFKDNISKKAELFLFLADRAETIEIIKQNFNKTIISDRSVISGIAYALEWFDFNMLVNLNKFATDSIFPSKVIILQLDKETLKNRLSQKEHDNIEKRGIDYLLRIQENIINTCKRLEIPYIIIDASKSIEEINFRIKRALGV
jgi:dTMP kinase